MNPAPQPPDGSPAANCGPGHLADTFRARTGDTQAIHQLYRVPSVEPDEVSFTPAPIGPPARPGDRIGPYELREPLGSGGTCLVFLGWDGSRGRPVAVKVLNWATVCDRPTALRQMRTEAAALARVKHPRVVGFVDFGFDPRWPYLVTDVVDGVPLGELVRSGGPLPPAWATHLVSQVADGLGAVWRAGLVHRDVKPDNVLVGPTGTATLIDFGLAKAPALQARAPTGPELAGTAAYLAPEQARDSSVVDLRADVYALGVTYYEVLTGRLPFEGKNRMQVIFQHLNAAPVPPADRAPEIPPLISDLCLWMLAKNPDERPQSADELRTAFAAVMGN
ncbi:MAG TPA: serine/threonine-protein kinase [Fimbriiglobus sp.]|jgi:serine/threonine-protein kinase|nr:serine/threonine-protein kinase [Fimbriiglobus sp.]